MQDIREGLGAKSYFKYNFFFLNYCGIWPFQSNISKIFFRFIWAFQELFIALAELIKLFEIYKEVDYLLEALPPFIYNRLNDILFMNAILNQHKMTILLNKIQNHWDSLRNESELQILTEASNYGRLINVGFIGMVYSALWSCMLLPLLPLVLDIVQPLNETRPLQPLFMCEFFVDPDKYYWTILAHNYMSALASPIPLLGMDLFFMNCCNHTCGITRILGFRIDSIAKSVELKNESKTSTYKQLCDCADLHQTIFDFCSSINDLYRTTFLFVLFINMTLMSFTGVAAVIKMDDFSKLNDVMRFGVFTTAQIFHLFCINYMGQSVLTAMEVLEAKIYNINWYELPLESQDFIQVIIMKNHRPTVIQGGIFPLSLPTFTTVMKTSMSYFTVIKSSR